MGYNNKLGDRSQLDKKYEKAVAAEKAAEEKRKQQALLEREKRKQQALLEREKRKQQVLIARAARNQQMRAAMRRNAITLSIVFAALGILFLFLDSRVFAILAVVCGIVAACYSLTRIKKEDGWEWEFDEIAPWTLIAAVIIAVVGCIL